MDTHRSFLTNNLSGLPNNIVIPDIDEKISMDLKAFISYEEELEAVHQLFELFLFNLNQMTNFCTLYYSDKIIRNIDEKEIDFIEINALLINIISAGKTLVDGMEKFLKTEFGEIRADNFKRLHLSKKYDDVFSYRFLCYLRNFAQHGYLPVSKNLNGTYCFDLYQIMSTLHIKPSPSIKQSMEKVSQEIVEIYQGEPHIAFTYTLDTYTLTVVELYYSFLIEIEEDSNDFYRKVQTILTENPELILHIPNAPKDLVAVELKDKNLHVFLHNMDYKDIFYNYKKQAEEKVNYYKHNHYEPS